VTTASTDKSDWASKVSPTNDGIEAWFNTALPNGRISAYQDPQLRPQYWQKKKKITYK
jgi:hypothetical protein